MPPASRCLEKLKEILVFIHFVEMRFFASLRKVDVHSYGRAAGRLTVPTKDPDTSTGYAGEALINSVRICFYIQNVCVAMNQQTIILRLKIFIVTGNRRHTARSARNNV